MSESYEWLLAVKSTNRRAGRDYGAFPIAIRVEVAEMPWGRRTGQRVSLSSTRNTRLASAGGWSKGLLIMRKSRPICSTRIVLPLSSNCIFTLAECPP